MKRESSAAHPNKKGTCLKDTQTWLDSSSPTFPLFHPVGQHTTVFLHGGLAHTRVCVRQPCRTRVVHSTNMFGRMIMWRTRGWHDVRWHCNLTSVTIPKTFNVPYSNHGGRGALWTHLATAANQNMLWLGLCKKINCEGRHKVSHLSTSREFKHFLCNLFSAGWGS